MRCVLSFDIGGTSLKGALINAQGEIVALDFLKQRPPVPDLKGCCELDPEQLWHDFKRLAGLVLSKSQATGIQIDGIVISAITRTQIFLNKNGQSVRPAMTWADSRARDQAGRIASAVQTLDKRFRTFGPINAYHPLARILWLLEKEPQNFEQLYCVLEPKDYLNFRLTGAWAADEISLSRLTTIVDRKPAEELFSQLNLPIEIIPPLMSPQHCIGPVLSGLDSPFDRLAGVPVFAGSMDAWCASLGLGALRPQYAYDISGTSEVLGVLSDSYEEIPGLVTLPWYLDLYQIGGPSQTGADCLRWYQEAFGSSHEGIDPGRVLQELEKRYRQPEPIVFLPYLRGERTPLWDPDVRGLFFGINRRHSSTDFIWAILEGVAFAGRQILELATKFRKISLHEVRIGGGAARSDLWCQIKSSIWKYPVTRMKEAESALLGAAMVGYCGLAEYSSLDQAQAEMAHKDRSFEPSDGAWREHTKLYDLLYENFLEIQKAALPLSRSLVQRVHNHSDLISYQQENAQ